MRSEAPFKAWSLPNRLTTPSAWTAKGSVSIGDLRAHAAQPVLRQLNHSLLSGRNVGDRSRQEGGGQEMHDHTANQALQGEKWMHSAQATGIHLCLEVS